jgi:hypothetical protein
MITADSIARSKQRVDLGLSGVPTSFDYDHETQLAHRKVDADAFRISMKSDTAFDREADPSDEK